MQYKKVKLEEMTKGSLNYQVQQISSAFREAFPEGPNGPWWNVEEIFDDHLIVEDMSEMSKLKDGEYYNVGFSLEGENYTFMAQPWPVVEETYQPSTSPEPVTVTVESTHKSKLNERISAMVLLEAVAGNGMRKMRANDVITAGVVNGNGRRYPAGVLKAAVDELRNHLHESAGQGRIIQVLGEAEHPTDKGSKRPNLLETVIKWDDVSFDGTTVSLGGIILGTSKGKDLQAIMEGGVTPGVSLRGYGETRTIKENGQSIDEITSLTLTGFDLVLEPSFADAQAVLESKQPIIHLEDEMEAKELQEKLDAQSLELAEAKKAVEELAENKRKASVEGALIESTKDLAYGEDGNKSFVEAVRAANPQDAAAVTSLVEAKRAEYDKLFAGRKLEKMGFGGRVSNMAPVLEAETGTPEFARGAFEINESIRRASGSKLLNLKSPITVNEKFAVEYLKKFDAQYKPQLMAESMLMQEAEQASDLNLPYSVARSIVAEAFPTLVASGIFDVQMTDQAPTSNLWYEDFSAESGMTANAVSKEEVVITALSTWYSLTKKFVNIGSVSVTNAAENVTYTLNSDYVIDYMNGRIMGLATIGAGDTVKVTYTYDAIRTGEMSAIQQGKQTLSYKSLTIAADRLATEISREAIVFSRASLGYDAVTKTLASMARQIARRIDKGMFYLGLSAALSVASNSGGDYDISGHNFQDLVEKLGVARVKVLNRYYQPNAVCVSVTNGDELANWDGFSQAGSRADADLNANGFVGRVKGLPVFASTEMSDSYFLVANRELVMHRIFQTLQFRGPFPSYSSNKMIAAEQYYAEEFNGTDAPVAGKGATVAVV